MATVALEGVSKRFGKTEVLHGIEAHVDDGEFLVLVGPSGCGKSTILRLIAGLETIDAGTVRINGQAMNGLEPMHRNVAMVFQNYALYPHMTVFKNMAYGLKVRGTPRPEITKRVEDTAHMLGIEDYLDRKPRQLSGGQRQRVAMGRAVVRDPSVFLFDEPLSNLDARLRTQMRIELKRLHRRLGNTFIYVTHDQVEAMTLGDRIMVMNAGRVEQIGTPDEIYHDPQTVFTAEFMGSPSMNLLPGQVMDEGRTLLLDQHQPIRLEDPLNIPKGEIIAGIRPEHLTFATDANPSANTLAAGIDIVEALGADTVIHCKTAHTGMPLVVKLHPDACRGLNGSVTIGLNPARLHLFDARSGLRVENPASPSMVATHAFAHAGVKV